MTLISTYTKMLKGQCHKIFCFWYFPLISFPPALEYLVRTVSNFFTSVFDTSGEFATGINDTGGKFATGVMGTISGY
jgi:hypothetical protein